MKNFFILFPLILFAGCVSIEEAKLSNKKELTERRSLTKMRFVRLGMTVAEVESILGREIKIGYKENDQTKQAFEALTIENPHRSESFDKKGKAYNVQYYLTSVKKPDGIVSEDELTPLIFHEEKLIGKGWNYLFKLKNQ